MFQGPDLRSWYACAMQLLSVNERPAEQALRLQDFISSALSVITTSLVQLETTLDESR